MRTLRSKRAIIIVAALAAAVTSFIFSTRSHTVDFNTEVKPIFNKKCITCHGGVRRKAGFSLLFRADALANNESGKPAIVPGDPGRSELLKRITSNDVDERMPYKHEPLTDEEISTLRRWISKAPTGATIGPMWLLNQLQYQKLKQIGQRIQQTSSFTIS